MTSGGWRLHGKKWRAGREAGLEHAIRTTCELASGLAHNRRGEEGREKRPGRRLMNKAGCSIKTWNQMPDMRQSRSRGPSFFDGAHGGTGSHRRQIKPRARRNHSPRTIRTMNRNLLAVAFLPFVLLALGCGKEESPSACSRVSPLSLSRQRSSQ